MKEEYILKLVQIQNQFRFLHWQTTFDAKHKAYGNVYESLDDFIDEFGEDENRVELDEGELIVFLNEYYTINPDSLPRADFY